MEISKHLKIDDKSDNNAFELNFLIENENTFLYLCAI
jgi:hypothetical protein